MKKCCFALLTALLFFRGNAQSRFVPQTGHNGSFCMALSNDDQKLLTAGLDGRLMLWNVNAAKALYNKKISEAGIYCLAWKTDGTTFALGTADSLLLVYDALSLSETKRLKLPFAPSRLCFNPQHDVLAIGGGNGMIKVADYKTGNVYFSFQPDSYISGLAFSSNGALLFAAGWNNGLCAYEMNQGKTMMTLPTLPGKHTAGMSLAANNQWMLMHLDDGTTEVIDLQQAKSTGSISSPFYYQDPNTTLYLEPVLTADSKFIITASPKNELVINQRPNGPGLVYNNTFSKAPVSAIVPSHDNRFFMLADAEGRISTVYFNETLFRNESPLLWRKLQSSPERIMRVDFHDNDQSLALTGNGHYRFNMVTGDMHRRDNDSAIVSNRNFINRYFLLEPASPVYYHADLLHNTGYEVDRGVARLLPGMAWSTDTQVVALHTPGHRLVMRDLAAKKTLLDMDVSADADFMLMNGTLFNHFMYRSGNTLHVLDKKGQTVKAIALNDVKTIWSIAADSKMQKLYILDQTMVPACYDMKTGERLKLDGSLAGQKARMMDLSPDGSTLALYETQYIRFFDTQSGRLVFELPLGDDLPVAFTFSQKSNRLAVSLDNGITQLWSIDAQKKLVSIITTPQDGMLVYTDENHYMATREAARQMVFTQGNEPVSLANADLTYNRPDKVLERIGLSDQRLINAYRFAYERRIQKNKVQVKDHYNVPVISLANQQELKASTGNGEITLRLKASDEQKKLARLHVWLNNVPVFGRSGLATGDQNSIEKSVSISLMSGTNRIRYSVVNEEGIESEKQEITVVNTRAEKPDLYLLTIGTSRYKNDAFNLQYAAKDATDLKALFSSTGGKNAPYRQVFTQTLVDEKVTADNLEKTKAFLQKARSNDIVIVFVAGHGVRDEQMNYFFGTYDMNFDAPGEKGFSEENFAQLMDGIRAVRRLVFFDTCLSGELDKDEAEQATTASVAQNNNVTFRTAGAGLRKKTSGLYNASALMREIYNDLDEGTGSTVISSAGGAEFAMESSEWKNGLFTYCFLNGLKNLAADANNDREITVSELQDYVRREVFRLSGGKQQPSFKDENLVMNYRIW